MKACLGWSGEIIELSIRESRNFCHRTFKEGIKMFCRWTSKQILYIRPKTRFLNYKIDTTFWFGSRYNSCGFSIQAQVNEPPNRKKSCTQSSPDSRKDILWLFSRQFENTFYSWKIRFGDAFLIRHHFLVRKGSIFLVAWWSSNIFSDTLMHLELSCHFTFSVGKIGRNSFILTVWKNILVEFTWFG